MGLLNEHWSLFFSKLERVNPSRKGFDAIRPAHDDKKPV